MNIDLKIQTFTATKNLDWETQGLCVNPSYNPEWWFPDETTPAVFKRWALSICRQCPVKVECLEYGMGHAHGIFGGYTSRQRKTLYNKYRPHPVI
jgi:WhiB family transcriptional regulator, redox-sensing transcriptional regulator